MPASPAVQHSVVVCSYTQQHTPFVIQGQLNLLVTSVSLKEKCFLKSTTSVINLNAFYCEVVHLSTREISCNVEAGILIGKWHNLVKCSTWARQVGSKSLNASALMNVQGFSNQYSIYFPCYLSVPCIIFLWFTHQDCHWRDEVFSGSMCLTHHLHLLSFLSLFRSTFNNLQV